MDETEVGLRSGLSGIYAIQNKGDTVRECGGSFDGSIPRNPGQVCYWAWVLADAGGAIIDQSSGGHRVSHEPLLTVQVAEYAGLINLLETYLIDHAKPGDIFTAFGDSQLVIYQVGGRYAVNAPHLIPLFDRVVDLIKMVKLVIGSPVRIQWVPREQNEVADALSRPS